MKKIVSIYFLIVVSLTIFYSPKIIFAINGVAGTIQLINFQSQITTAFGDSIPVTINFVYSGNYSSQLGASIQGIQPNGVTLSPVSLGTNGNDSVILSGVPAESGDFSLTLVITDNNGAMLTQPFNYDVLPNNINANILPDATVNQPYSQNICFGNYSNDYVLKDVLVEFSIWSSDGSNYSSIFPLVPASNLNSDGCVLLKLTPKKTGLFTVKTTVFDGASSGNQIDARSFLLNINNPAVVAPVTVPLVIQTPTTSPVSTPSVTPVITQQPTVKTITATNNLPTGCTSTSGFSPTTGVSCSGSTILQTTSHQDKSQPKPQAKLNNFSNMFSNVWNFIKNIFK